jgi:hypothetical protein
METFLSLAVGIGLAAACGLRVFVPLLALNLAAMGGFLVLPSGWAWMGGPYATLAFCVATILEILGCYYIPWVDHALDTIASPAAVIAGTLTTAALVTDLPPFLHWTLALIAGGGIAGVVQGATVALRAKSSLATAGAANPLLATVELVGSAVTSLVAIFIPVVCLALILFFLIWVLKKLGKFTVRKK